MRAVIMAGGQGSRLRPLTSTQPKPMLPVMGERAFLVDRTGRVLEGRTGLLGVVWLVARTYELPTVALPVSASRVAREIVQAVGGRVRWTKLSPAAIMDAASQDDVMFAGDQDGGLVFPAFLPVFDAMFSLAKVLEMLSSTGLRFDQVIDGLPAAHIAHRTVTVPWEAKGTVMRRLLEHLNGHERTETVDGVKAFRGGDWALVVPHPLDPEVRVWAEAGSSAGTEALANEFGALVDALKA